MSVGVENGPNAVVTGLTKGTKEREWKSSKSRLFGLLINLVRRRVWGLYRRVLVQGM